MRTLACQSLLTRPAMKAREHEGLVVAAAVTAVGTFDFQQAKRGVRDML